jgi:tagatose-1,6-bisphosphate aldolase
MSTAAVPRDLGKVRGLQRVTSAAGFFEICALDHLSDFAELLGPDPSVISYADVVTAKDALVRALSPSVSAWLLDARYGLQAVATGALPGSVGLMSAIEDEDYSIPEGPRRTRYRDGWSLRQIKLAGADVAKLLWFYRPDGDPATAEHQRYVVRSLADECARLSLPLVVEPIWYPLPGEDPESPGWKAARVDGILASAFEANSLGVDMLKVEFPGYVGSRPGRDNAAAACKELDAGIGVPWVILSAGVGYAEFVTQVEIACRAGASGYLAGRSIWRDAVSTHDPAAREAAVAEARSRLDQLNAITRANGRPYVAAHGLPEVIEAMPDGWFKTWHPSPKETSLPYPPDDLARRGQAALHPCRRLQRADNPATCTRRACRWSRARRRPASSSPSPRGGNRHLRDRRRLTTAGAARQPPPSPAPHRPAPPASLAP